MNQRSEQKRQYYKKNEDKIKEQSQQRYKKNKDKINEQHRQYREKNKDKTNEQSRQYRKNNKDEINERQRQRLYGLINGGYNQLFQQQNGCCAICGKHQSKLSQVLGVDHNHITGKIRGLLCKRCNVGLGNFEENINSLQGAINYLHQNSSNSN